jgi:acetyl esterase
MKTLLHLLSIATILVAPGLLPAQTSENDERFRKFLESFPKSDLDKDGVLTRDEVREFNQARRGDQDRGSASGKAPPPTHADVSYGDHPEQAFDIWIAEGEDGNPTPLCIYIHGGGFRSGDKRSVSTGDMKRFLDAGISFASMNYRLTNGGEFPYPIAMHDAARGLQTIRSKAEEWGIDPDKIACYGGSAGAGISLWLGFHDDLAHPDSDDPVARQSTRIVAAGTSNGQSTYDMRTFRQWFNAPNLAPHDALVTFYAMKDGEDPDTERVASLAEDASAIAHLSKDDIPVYMTYSGENSPVDDDTNQGTWVHHPLLGLKLQEAMTSLGLDCYVSYAGNKADAYPNMATFLIEKLRASP